MYDKLCQLISVRHVDQYGLLAFNKLLYDLFYRPSICMKLITLGITHIQHIAECLFILQLVQVTVNTIHLENACEYLEDFISNITG